MKVGGLCLVPTIYHSFKCYDVGIHAINKYLFSVHVRLDILGAGDPVLNTADKSLSSWSLLTDNKK